MIGLLLLTVGFITKPKKLIAEDEVPVEFIKELTKDELVKKVYYYGKKYNVNPQTMISVINCENKEWDTNLQSRIINKKGVREDSWGLSQIHKPSHPTLTHKQITDPDFAIEFMAKNISQGKGNMWTCYRKLNN